MNGDMMNGESWPGVNPLRDDASSLLSGNQKKKTHFVGLLFLTGLWTVLTGLCQCCPLVSAQPAKVLFEIIDKNACAIAPKMFAQI